jgi:hypothetical protein
MSQQIGITMGIPALSAIATAQADVLDGVTLAIAVDVALCVVAAVAALAAGGGLRVATRRRAAPESR